jgi:hypothetical protein
VVLEGALRRPLLLQAHAQGVSSACYTLTMESPFPLCSHCTCAASINAKQSQQSKFNNAWLQAGPLLADLAGSAGCRRAGTQYALSHFDRFADTTLKGPSYLEDPTARGPAQAERSGLALLARLTAHGRLRAALAALRGAFCLAAPEAQGFAAALVSRLEGARLAAAAAPPGPAQRELPYPTLLGLSAADVQELLDDAIAEGGGCAPAGAAAADAVGSRAATASGIQGLGLTVTGTCPHALLHA